MDKTELKATEREEKTTNYKMIVVLTLAILVIGSSFFIATSTRVSFCALCHGNEVKELQSSKHMGINCNFCHSERGWLGFVRQRISTARMIGSYLLNTYEKPIIAEVENKPCLYCHQSVEQKIIVKRAIRMSHKEVNESEYECTYCHNTIAHSKSTPAKKVATMEKCLECHNSEQVSSKCGLCHITEVNWRRRKIGGPWRITHGSSWRQTHGMGNLKICSACHRKTYCSRCHGTAMPHTGFWLNFHGDEALKNRKGCFTCHRQEFCRSCHRLEMPHPKNFLPTHSKQAKKLGLPVCFNCHMQAGCSLCHEKHVHPGLPRWIVKWLRGQMGRE
jgi:hypothetical protein